MDISAEIQKYRQEIKSERMDMSFGEIINMYRDKEIIISPEYRHVVYWFLPVGKSLSKIMFSFVCR